MARDWSVRVGTTVTATNAPRHHSGFDLDAYVARRLDRMLNNIAKREGIAWIEPTRLVTANDVMGGPAVIFLAEREGLRIITPNLMPTFVFFPRLAKLGRLFP